MTNQDLSSQSTCDCNARPGQLHIKTCQYVKDVHAQQAARVVREAEWITRWANFL